MGTHNAFNLHSTHVQEYLQSLVQGLPAGHVSRGVALVDEADFGGEWQARKIWEATRSAASMAAIISGAETIVTTTDIHQQLLTSGALADDSFRQYWHYFVSPARPPAPVNIAKIPDLARRVTEDYYRTKHADIYNNGLSYDLPLNDLIAQVKANTSELDRIAQRLVAAPGLGGVSEVAA
jgi:hypothetical protein